MAIAPGMLLKERYKIEEVLGQGGMGAVYRANDELLSISVAVKENLFFAEEYTRQFLREGKILASLRHRSLPRVIDYCSIPGQGQYLIMDFIEGEDLKERIERVHHLPEKDVIIIGVDICDALIYMHSREMPVIHRDIKPGNIKITSDHEVVLVDFGLAKITENPSQHTMTGARAMTPGFSPPEQYGTARTDGRSDIYSLGATLYVALTGKIPEDALERVTQRDRLTPINELAPGVRPELARVIERALELDPDDRFQNAKDFRDALVEATELRTYFTNTITLSAADEVNSNQAPVKVLNQRSSKQRKQYKKRASRGMRRGLWVSISFLIVIASLTALSFLTPSFLEELSHIRAAFFRPTMTVAVEDTPDPAPTDSATVSPTPTVTETETLVLVEQNTQEPTASKTMAATQAPSLTPDTAAVLPNGVAYDIVFVSNRSGTNQLWLMQDDGSDQIQLTDISGGACQPDWSPDGKQIVFISPCTSKMDTYPDSSLYVYDLVTDDYSLLMPDGGEFVGDFEPSWSPTGNKIAFTSLRSGILHIYTYDLATQQIDEISNTTLEDRYPSWDPEGESLLFTRKRINWVVWSINQFGNDAEQVSMSGNVNNHTPRWASDRSMIVFSQNSESSNVPWLVGLASENLGTTSEFRITPKDLEYSVPVVKPRFSPDDKKVIFESWPDGRNHDIYVLNVDGSQLTRLTTDPNYDFGPVWRK